jgi:hypothetical protein
MVAGILKDEPLVHPDTKTIAATNTFRLITCHISDRKLDAIIASVATAINTYRATSMAWANARSL